MDSNHRTKLPLWSTEKARAGGRFLAGSRSQRARHGRRDGHKRGSRFQRGGLSGRGKRRESSMPSNRPIIWLTGNIPDFPDSKHRPVHTQQDAIRALHETGVAEWQSLTHRAMRATMRNGPRGQSRLSSHVEAAWDMLQAATWNWRQTERCGPSNGLY
jgi:hypothetical protein